MFERISLKMGELFLLTRQELKREEGQGATEYAMVVGLVVVGLGITLGLMGTSIKNFLGEVGLKIDALI